MKLHTYLNYGGNCEQAFRFYEKHLGGKITMMMTHGEHPVPNDVPPDWKIDFTSAMSRLITAVCIGLMTEKS